MNTPGKRALFDNLDRNETLAIAIDATVRAKRQDDWRGNKFKIKRVKNAIRAVLQTAGTHADDGNKVPIARVVKRERPAYAGKSSDPLDAQVEAGLALVKNQDEY